MLFIASEKCLESPTDCGKASVSQVPHEQSKKREKESSKNEKKGRGEGWVGLSLQISCTRMRYMKIPISIAKYSMAKTLSIKT